jgi:NADH-quinone oxidoreductase subunit L
MNALIGLIPAIPFFSFLVLSLTGLRLTRPLTAFLGVGAVGLSAILSVIVAFSFFSSDAQSFEVVLWQWMDVGGFKPEFGL